MLTLVFSQEETPSRDNFLKVSKFQLIKGFPSFQSYLRTITVLKSLASMRKVVISINSFTPAANCLFFPMFSVTYAVAEHGDLFGQALNTVSVYKQKKKAKLYICHIIKG